MKLRLSEICFVLAVIGIYIYCIINNVPLHFAYLESGAISVLYSSYDGEYNDFSLLKVWFVLLDFLAWPYEFGLIILKIF